MALGLVVDGGLAEVPGVLGEVGQAEVLRIVCLSQESGLHLLTIPALEMSGNVVPQSLSGHRLGPAAVEEYEGLLLLPGPVPAHHVLVQVPPVVLGEPPEDLDILSVKVHDMLMLGQEEVDGVLPASLPDGLHDVGQSVLVVGRQVDLALGVDHDQSAGSFLLLHGLLTVDIEHSEIYLGLRQELV